MPVTTIRIPMAYPVDFRSGSTDKGSKMVNCYAEKSGDMLYAVKRPGYEASGITFGAGVGQGLFTWKNAMYGVVNNVLYSSTGGSPTTVGSLTGTVTPCYFNTTLNEPYMFFQKGDKGYTYDGTTLKQVKGDNVSYVTLTNTGSGYTSVPSVTFTAPPSGTTATGTAVMAGGGIGSIPVTTQGSGYTSPPIVSIGAPTLPGGVQATAVAQLTSGKVTKIIITEEGQGYISAPTVSLSGGSPTTAAVLGTAVLSQAPYVTSITITDQGSGYTTAPTITIGASWAASTAVSVGDQFAANGNLYQVTIAGTTGTTAPTHTSGTATNGTATLLYVGPQATATATLNFFPTDPLVPGTAYLDGYTFVMTTSGRIYNSAVNDPTRWNALDYITAAAEPDNGVAIAKHLNYVVAFGQWSTEFFYDAANPTGSPLLPNPSYRIEFGCANGNSVAKMEESLIWIAVGQNNGKMVMMLDGVRPTQLSDVSIERILDNSSLTNVRAYTIKISGHFFYVLQLLDDNLTLVCDVRTHLWSIWTSYVNNEEVELDGTYYTMYNNNHYALDHADGKVYNIKETYYTDEAGPIQFRIRTNRLDADSTKRKFISRLEVVGDKVKATLGVRYSDDDYENWSPYRNIDLNTTRSVLYQNGNFRRRAYEFFSTDNVPIRLQHCEFDFDIGTN